MNRDITKLIADIKGIIDRHQLGRTGTYARWLWQPVNPDARRRLLGINEYGCADAANILYTIGEFPSEPEERQAWVNALQSLQHPDTGFFMEETHHNIHTTAHCIAALELFDQKALHPLKALHPYCTREGLYRMLEGLEWDDNPWNASHQGAGLFAALVLQGEVDLQWKEWYFDWFWENADPETGFWRKGSIGKNENVGIFPHLAGTFHYLFNHEYAHMPLRYPEKMVDTCLDILDNNLWPILGKNIGFSEIDWVFCLTRATRQCPWRFEEGREALRRFAEAYLDYLESLDPMTDDGLNDLHALFGAVCCLAELQAALPGEITSEKPLKLVLDRRPFI